MNKFPVDFLIKLNSWIKLFISKKYHKYTALLLELKHHRYGDSLKYFNWKEFRIGQLIIASVLINLLELSTPIYINIVYSVILPRQATESLIILTMFVVVMMIVSAWLKTTRLQLVGEDSARVTHEKRVNAISHLLAIPISSFLESSPSKHISRLNSINLLRDESALQSLTTAIDLIFSFIFILFLFMIGGSIIFPVIIGITIYFLKSLSFSKDFESVSKEQDQLEIERLNTQIHMIDSIDLLKVNGLNTHYLTSIEPLHENLSWRRMKNNQYLSNQQAFGLFISQVTLAAVVLLGAILVINDRLQVGALAASILLIGKIFNPWQKLSTLWSNYRSLAHSQNEYSSLMNTPTISNDYSYANTLNTISSTGNWTIATLELGLLSIEQNKATLLDDHLYGHDVKKMFANLVLVDNNQNVLLNGISTNQYDMTDLVDKIRYINPAHGFFNGTLLQNLTCFQPSKFKRNALFWSYLLGIDQKIKALPMGYESVVGNQTTSGLPADEEKLLRIITGLSTNPMILLLDLNDFTFGKYFIDGLQMIIDRCRGRTTLLISGSSPIVKKISDRTIYLAESNKTGVLQ